MTILKAENITKKYAGAAVLQDVSISLASGQKLGLKAESGRGKTTLLHILAGLDKAFAGRVYSSAERRGMVFQNLALFPHKTVAENIAYPTQRRGQRELDPLYQGWLQVTGLNKYTNCYPHQLSRGMCQKVALIRAFLPRPELVFLDEPVSALDLKSKTKIFAFVKDNYDEASLIMASHSDWELQQLCTTIFELDG